MKTVRSMGPVRRLSVCVLIMACVAWTCPAVHAQTLSGPADADLARILPDLVGALPKAAAPPLAPGMPGARDITSSSITWTWADNSSDETGFKVWADPGVGSPATLQIIAAAGATAWKQPGLLANTLYSFQVASTALYLDSARTGPYSAWTQAAKPTAPVVGNPRKTTLSVALGEGDSNPAGTEYAMMCATTGQWLSAGGALTSTPEYHADTVWGTVTVTGLTPASVYSFVAVARNGVGSVTAVGPVSKGSTLTTVPNVVAMNRLQAQSSINGAKLANGLLTETYSNAIPAGIVMSQSPAAGTDAALGDMVSLVVSLGPAPVTVPNLVGLPRAQAQAAITGVSLAVGAVGEEYSSTVAAGSVSFQLPAAGTQIAGGSAVNFMMSRGPAPTEVPTLTGLTRAQAEVAIAAARLEVGVMTEDYSSSVPAGSVIAQVPAAGWFVSAGTEVTLTLSKGPATSVAVPNVVGLVRTQAETALAAAHLAVGAVADAYSTTLAVGTVLSQYPAPGTETVTGTAVNLVVIRGAAPVPVPNLVALTRDQARTNLTAAGLVLGSATEAYSATVAAGLVMAQNPATGVQVAPGTAVNIAVSTGSSKATVPDVVGVPRNSAEYALVNAGLATGTIALASSAVVAPGEVISQNPAAGSQVTAGTKVSLVVNRADGDQAEVPDVIGLALEQAKAAVIGASLTVGEITEAPSDTTEAGVVLGQNPASGTIMAADAGVGLVVSSGPESGGCFQCNSQKMGLSGAKKAFGDFFLTGLSLATLLTMTRKRI